ncbi:TnpV protein [Eubacterium callanderi]|uniref:TnpV protein n=2 Tax=Eubacterium callanderi TaxID=53442 RepID=UPI0034647742
MRNKRNNEPMKGAMKMNVTYSQQGDYLLPNLTVPEEVPMPQGKYASLRKTYLMQHHYGLYLNLFTQGKLNAHLTEIQETASRRMALITTQMMAAEGINEALKAKDPMRWTGLVNNLQRTAEEQILQELIYN